VTSAIVHPIRFDAEPDGRLARALAAAFAVTALLALALGALAWRPPAPTVAALERRIALVPWDTAPRRRSAPGRRRPRALGGLRPGALARARRAGLAAARVAPNDPAACHRAALVLLQADAPAAAPPSLRCVLANDPARAWPTLDVAHAVYRDPTTLLERVAPPGPAGVRQLLGWAYGRGELTVADVAWTALATVPPTAADRLRHVDFLIAQGQVETAEGVWAETYGPRPPGVVFDGGFERDLVGAGFGWWLGRPQDARIAIEGGTAAARGRRGLAIDFRGGNPEFRHVSQVVPVEAGRRYRITALVASEAVSSLSGPRLRVDAMHACLGLAQADGPDIRGTTAWRSIEVPFVTPPGCRAVILRVVRPATGRLDRDLRGRLYLDEVALVDDGPA
jgi:hypothetical protein